MTLALPQPLVSADWLNRHIGHPKLRIVDGSWRLPGAGNAHADYLQRHIPGAAFFSIDDIADRETDLPHMLPQPRVFEDAMGALGISEDDLVVVYDDRGVFSAPRVWWTFKTMGHEAVAVLDGGLPAWVAAGGDVTSSPAVPVGGSYAARRADARVATADDVRRALADPSITVLDARPAPRFMGLEPEPRPGLAQGAMPGARNLPFSDLLLPDGRFRSHADLDAAFARRGATESAATIVTCGSGVTAAILALGLEALGRGPARLYDGSWAEWGRLDHDRALFPVSAGGK